MVNFRAAVQSLKFKKKRGEPIHNVFSTRTDYSRVRAWVVQVGLLMRFQVKRWIVGFKALTRKHMFLID